MKIHTVIDGNAFYEIDEKCYEELMRKREQTEKRENRKKEGISAVQMPEAQENK